MPLTPPNISVLPKAGFLIGGDKLTEVGEQSYDHRYAATGAVTQRIPLGSNRDMDKAVRAARAGFEVWSRMPANQRRILMLKLASLIREHAPELSLMTTTEIGRPSATTARSPTWVAELFEYNAGWADKLNGEAIVTWPGPALDYTREEPYGVIAVIVPWNGSFVSFGQTLGPALAAGNAVVIKPPELAPYSCLRLGELALEAGIPPGVVNVVPAGPQGGDALVRHKGVDKIHFTGSGETAKKIIAASLENLTPFGLELGGKSARLVFADSDLKTAARRAIGAIVGGAGQSCICASRVLVEKAIYETFIAECEAALKATPIGDPMLPSTVMGPVVSQTHAERILGFVDRAQEAGQRLVTGGSRLGGDLANGYFVAPTMFADVDHDAEIYRNEIFGPVLSFVPFSDEEEAVRLANDSQFGLAAYIESENVRRVHRLAAALEAGTVWVNGFVDLPVGAPFGGHKQSGVGRVGGIYGIREFSRAKNVWLQL